MRRGLETGWRGRGEYYSVGGVAVDEEEGGLPLPVVEETTGPWGHSQGLVLEYVVTSCVVVLVMMREDRV